MSAAIVFGLLSALVQFVSYQADGRAADDTAQLGRVQQIKSTLLNADALATNGFLVGGLEDPVQRADYDAAINEVLKQIAEAARAQEADLDVLKDLNVAVTHYATAVAQARANNRLGYPLGAQYLGGASADLRAVAIPILDALVAANTDRAEGSMAGQHPFWLLLVGILVLAALVLLNRQARPGLPPSPQPGRCDRGADRAGRHGGDRVRCVRPRRTQRQPARQRVRGRGGSCRDPDRGQRREGDREPAADPAWLGRDRREEPGTPRPRRSSRAWAAPTRSLIGRRTSSVTRRWSPPTTRVTGPPRATSRRAAAATRTSPSRSSTR
ncbi:hypothetical protein G5V59_24935 [Nocardioides sp. W3-2-3]|uniref:hypothetical protein n=1 Tax=Nocardioides convexus TaxID=2712224 RepID=UPI002418B627|nr:hypothetical protein [Nocardioides convexus]NHA01820.1 hypothetical protein [Nocardioides convexus]